MRRFGGPAAVANVTALAIWNDAEADEREMAGRAAWPFSGASLTSRGWLPQLSRARSDGCAGSCSIPVCDLGPPAKMLRSQSPHHDRVVVNQLLLARA
jgi:hypothetical protein